MSRERRFTQLDVYTDRALLGNPLAVVHGADGLSAGRVFVEHDGSDAWIGGHVSPCIEGTVWL